MYLLKFQKIKDAVAVEDEVAEEEEKIEAEAETEAEVEIEAEAETEVEEETKAEEEKGVEAKIAEEKEIVVKVRMILEEIRKTVFRNDEVALEIINQSSLEKDAVEVISQNRKEQVVNDDEEFKF